MFVNCSNHPSEKWSVEQRTAAEVYGDIVDVSFPDINPLDDEEMISNIAENVVDEITSHRPSVVMCQGEFTTSYAIINRLRDKGIKVVAACSRRDVQEIVQQDGSIVKQVVFRFERFREYV